MCTMGKSAKAPSACGRGRPPSVARSVASAASASGGRPPKKSRNDSSVAQAVKIATRCLVCTAPPFRPCTPSGRVWAQTEKVGTDDVPVGDFCRRCEDMRGRSVWLHDLRGVHRHAEE